MVAFLNRTDSGLAAGASSRRENRRSNFRFMGRGRLCVGMLTVHEKGGKHDWIPMMKSEVTANANCVNRL